jgi:hypothetical protein
LQGFLLSFLQGGTQGNLDQILIHSIILQVEQVELVLVTRLQLPSLLQHFELVELKQVSSTEQVLGSKLELELQ